MCSSLIGWLLLIVPRMGMKSGNRELTVLLQNTKVIDSSNKARPCHWFSMVRMLSCAGTFFYCVLVVMLLKSERHGG
jgi:hypothetical protein